MIKKYLRKLFVYLLFGIVMYSGYWFARDSIPVIVSVVKNGPLLLVLFLVLGLTLILIGVKLMNFAKNIFYQTTPVLSKTGLLASFSIISITVGGIWTGATIVNLAGAIPYFLVVKLLK